MHQFVLLPLYVYQFTYYLVTCTSLHVTCWHVLIYIVTSLHVSVFIVTSLHISVYILPFEMYQYTL